MLKQTLGIEFQIIRASAVIFMAIVTDLRAEIEGDIVETSGVSEEGMLMDFSDVSQILTVHIHDVVDHAFVIYEGDEEGRMVLSGLSSDHRTVIVPFIPTAENLAKWAFEQVQPHIQTAYGNRLRLVAMHVRETPKVGHHGMNDYSSSRSTRRLRLDLKLCPVIRIPMLWRHPQIHQSTDWFDLFRVLSAGAPGVSECENEILRSSPPGRKRAISSMDFRNTRRCSGEIERSIGTMSGNASSRPCPSNTRWRWSSYVRV